MTTYRSRWVGACNSHTKPMSGHVYRLIYFYLSFCERKEVPVQWRSDVTLVSCDWSWHSQGSLIDSHYMLTKSSTTTSSNLRPYRCIFGEEVTLWLVMALPGASHRLPLYANKKFHYNLIKSLPLPVHFRWRSVPVQLALGQFCPICRSRTAKKKKRKGIYYIPLEITDDRCNLTGF